MAKSDILCSCGPVGFSAGIYLRNSLLNIKTESVIK